MLALGERAAKIYRKGTYGNTMTGNPRALDIACAVMHLLTPELREREARLAADLHARNPQ